MARFASGHFAHAHQVEAHRADDLVQRDQDAQLAARHHVIDHPPEARTRALDVLRVDVAVAVLIETIGERPLAELRWRVWLVCVL